MREESFASPFQPVTLSRSDSNELQVVSKTILDANLGRYRHFVDLDGGDVSLETWKPVQSIDQVQVFVERQSRSSFTPFQVNPAAEKSILQPLLCVGSIPGRLDDIMFSLVKSRVDASLRGNELSEAAVLSTLKAPTAAHPFQSIAVKWAELDVRLKSMGFVKNHDYIFIQATGVQRLLSGERVGYHLLHSIDLVKAPILPGRVRAQLSVCSFFRQATKTSVSLYSLGMMDSMGDRARRVVVPHFIKALLSTFKPLQKLRRRTWLLFLPTFSPASIASTTLEIAVEQPPPATGTLCVCEATEDDGRRSLTVMETLFTQFLLIGLLTLKRSTSSSLTSLPTRSIALHLEGVLDSNGNAFFEISDHKWPPQIHRDDDGVKA
ncbi:unnamed protein product [Phytophthora lilii]|uniref:Unnamed protein product n=1 Tax=Phytophthora lilii TaxID=2077276 RepID=A0A9W6WXV1_9STRA|nr:unnamed protein product [Phytophthora lilii]